MFVKDPCGIMCLLMTYLAIVYADYVVVRWIILETMSDSLWGAFHVLIFNTGIFFMAYAHLKAVMMDPGMVPLPQARLDFSDLLSMKDEAFDRADWTLCRRCETYRPPRAHHCRICKRCVRRMDHHCPWINNCVGERNQKFFLQFLVYVGILACYTVILVALSWLRTCLQCNQEDNTIKQARILHSVILMLECVLFGMFVTAILVDQIQAIVNDATAVEQVQNPSTPYRRNRPKLALIREVCGRTHPIYWLLPCDNPHSHSLDLPLLSHDV